MSEEVMTLEQKFPGKSMRLEPAKLVRRMLVYAAMLIRLELKCPAKLNHMKLQKFLAQFSNQSYR